MLYILSTSDLHTHWHVFGKLDSNVNSINFFTYHDDWESLIQLHDLGTRHSGSICHVGCRSQLFAIVDFASCGSSTKPGSWLQPSAVTRLDSVELVQLLSTPPCKWQSMPKRNSWITNRCCYISVSYLLVLLQLFNNIPLIWYRSFFGPFWRGLYP